MPLCHNYYKNTKQTSKVSLILPLVTSFFPSVISPTLSPTFPLSLFLYLPSVLPPSNFLVIFNLQTIHMVTGLCSTSFMHSSNPPHSRMKHLFPCCCTFSQKEQAQPRSCPLSNGRLLPIAGQ